MRHFIALLGLAAVTAACAKKDPEPKPTPVQQVVEEAERKSAEIEAQTGRPVGTMTIRFVEPKEEDIVAMMVAAAGWARKSVSRSIGILQPTASNAIWLRAAEATTQRFALRPIQQSDLQVVCGASPGSTSSRGSQGCSMKYVNAVLMFNSFRMTRDTGYVTVGVIQVPNGSNRSETTFRCVTLLRRPGDWEAKHSELVIDHQRCPRP
jgi:hypothetical protein